MSLLQGGRAAVLMTSMCLLGACGGGSDPAADAPAGAAAPTASTATDSAAAAPKAGRLQAYLGENVCEVLSPAQLQQAFGAPAEVTVQPSPSRHDTSCSYSWPRPDADARQQAMLQAMMQNASRAPGEKVQLDMRKLAGEYSVSVGLKQTEATADRFVPPKLSEAELEERIRLATEAANKRLTDEQRKLVGDSAGDMASSMIRKTNDRVVIEGIGDAAYWLPIMGGTLNVLEGDVQITITPMLAEDMDGDIEAAKRVYSLLGQ